MDQLRLFVDRRPLRILVVDDDPSVVDMVCRRLLHVRADEIATASVGDLMDGGIGTIDADVVVVGIGDAVGMAPLRRLQAVAESSAVVALHHGAVPADGLDLVVTGAQDVLPLNEASPARLDRVIRSAVFRKRAETAALADALTDPVTGMPARAWMLRRLDLAVSHAATCAEGWQVAALFCDLDRFKAVNDSLGHAKGDEVLRMVADRLRSVVRAEDPIVRFGGDEFVILLEGHRIEGLAHRIALRALAALSEPFEVDGHAVSVFTSIGLALHRSGETAAELLDHADLALYQAKRHGRNRIEAFDDALRAWSDHQHDLAGQLRADLARGALALQRSTLWDLTSATVVGSVASPRWTPTSDPAELVDLAVRNGLGPQLGRWMTREAIAAAGSGQGSAGQIVVEVPPGLASQPAFVDWVDEVLTSSGTDPSRLVLALGEAELGEPDLVRPVVEGLDRLGVSVALSEFGSGRASLALFGSLTVDEVFLSSDLVAGIEHDPARRTVVESLLRIAAAIGQRVVACGPESLGDARTLVELGCEAAVSDLDLSDLATGPTVELPAFAPVELVPVR